MSKEQQTVTDLETSLSNSVDIVNGWLETTGEFASDQMPLIVEEIVMYGRVVETSTMAACLLGAIISIVLFIIAIKKIKNVSCDQDGFQVVLLLVAFLIFGIPSMVNGCVHIRPLCLAWAAPRLYIIDFIANVVGG